MVVEEEKIPLHRFLSFLLQAMNAHGPSRTREPSSHSPLGLVSHWDTLCVRGNSHHGSSGSASPYAYDPVRYLRILEEEVCCIFSERNIGRGVTNT